VNWEKRPASMPMHDLTINAYREAYGQLKDSVNGLIGKDGAELNRRVSNLMAAKNSLKELTTQQKAGRAPSIDFTQPTASVKSAAGHVAPAVITGAQKAAATAKSVAGTAAQMGALAEGDASQPWIKIQTSDGKSWEIHPGDLAEAKKRDPKLKILDQPNQP